MLYASQAPEQLDTAWASHELAKQVHSGGRLVVELTAQEVAHTVRNTTRPVGVTHSSGSIPRVTVVRLLHA